jgi:hypothetical protein
MNTTPGMSHAEAYGNSVPVSTAFSWHIADGDARAYAIEWVLTDLQALARSSTQRADWFLKGTDRQKDYGAALAQASQIWALLADRLPAILRAADWNAKRLERMPAEDPSAHAAWILGDQALLHSEGAAYLADDSSAEADRDSAAFFAAVANALTTLAAAAPAVLAARGRGQRVVDLGIDPLPVIDATAVCGPLLTANRDAGGSS